MTVKDFNKQKPICDLPPSDDGNQILINPPPCPPAPEPAVVTEAPIAPKCDEAPPLPEPFFIEKCLPCDWSAVCTPSTPPEIGCPPIVAGWGGYDGGIKEWFKLSHDKCNSVVPYDQYDWHSTLDLVSHSEHITELMIRYDGNLRQINEMEFRTLAARMATLGVTLGLLAPSTAVPDPTAMGLKVIYGNEGQAALTMTYNDQPIGTPLPLAAMLGVDGKIKGFVIPPNQ